MPENQAERAKEIEAAIKADDDKRRADDDKKREDAMVKRIHDAVMDSLKSMLGRRSDDGDLHIHHEGEGQSEVDDDRRRDDRRRRDARRRSDAEHPGTVPARESEPARGAAVDSRRRSDTEHGEDWGAGGGDGHPNPAREAKVDADEEASMVADDVGARERFTAAQILADSCYQAYCEHAPRFMAGEQLREYRVRLLKPYLKHSPNWKDVPLDRLDSRTLRNVEAAVYADAMKVATDSDALPAGYLREVKYTDASGRVHSRFYGDFRTAFGPWMLPARTARLRRPHDM